jgi:class 3 adenylate cyclase
MERRLATILAADVVGYARLMTEDEEGTLATLKDCRTLIDHAVATHLGRIFGSAGDSVIAEFSSAVEAVRCALSIQKELKALSGSQSGAKQMQFRIGIHLGDVMAEGDNLLGEGVNIAARLESLSPTGGILLSKSVFDQVIGKVEAEFANAGLHRLKNIELRSTPGYGRRIKPIN